MAKTEENTSSDDYSDYMKKTLRRQMELLAERSEAAGANSDAELLCILTAEMCNVVEAFCRVNRLNRLKYLNGII
jgi:hypothetical protein